MYMDKHAPKSYLCIVFQCPVCFPDLSHLFSSVAHHNIIEKVVLLHCPNLHSSSTNLANVLEGGFVVVVFWVGDVTGLPWTLVFVRVVGGGDWDDHDDDDGRSHREWDVPQQQQKKNTLYAGLSMSGGLHLPLYAGLGLVGRTHSPHPGALLHLGLGTTGGSHSPSSSSSQSSGMVAAVDRVGCCGMLWDDVGCRCVGAGQGTMQGFKQLRFYTTYHCRVFQQAHHPTTLQA